MQELINSVADRIYFGVVVPLFSFLARMLELILIRPFQMLHTPPWLHLFILAVCTAMFSLYLRRLLKVEEKAARFQEIFAEKRRRQQNLQLIPEKYTRAALYEVTDEELNDLYNTYLAQHYARYVMIYLLPIFLVMAWLNRIFSRETMVSLTGTPFVIELPANGLGIEGLSVTFFFLATYVAALMIGFYIRRRLRSRLR